MIAPSTRKSRIFAGISANLIGQVLTSLIQLIGVPIFLSFWGKEYYGEWLILFTIPSYLGMSDLGLGTVATTEMAMCISKGEPERAAKIFRVSFLGILMIGIIVCIIFAISIPILPWHDWLHLHQITFIETSITLALLTAYVFGTIVLTLPLGIYRVTGRYGRGQIASYLFRTAEFISVVALVISGYGAIAAATAMLLVRFFFISFIWMEVRKFAPWLHFHPFRWDWHVIRPLAIPSISMTTIYTAQSLVNQGLVTLIGISLGAANVVIFSMVRTLCNFARQIIGAINLSVFSEFSISLGNDDLVSARRLHVRTVQANIILTFLATIGLKIFGGWVLFHWAKGEITVEEPFFTLYLCYILFNSIWSGSWSMLLGSNRHKGLTRYFLLSSIATLVLIYYGLSSGGLSVIPVILLIADIIFSFFVFKKSASVLQQPLGLFFSSMLKTQETK